MKWILPMVVTMLMSSCLYVVEPRVDYRDRILGYYSVDEFSRTFNDYTLYSMHISRSSQGYDVININNLYATGLRVKAYIRQDRITIPYQVIDGFEFEGYGTVRGGRVYLYYNVTDRYNWGPTDYLEAEGVRE